MITYASFHTTYTLPVMSVLALIAHPFINRSEIFKITAICCIAFVYTTPWDNYVIQSGGWGYLADRVMAYVGYVPVEEYAFFIIQTVMVSLLHVLCARWSTPCLHFNRDRRSYLWIRWTPIAALAAVAATGYWIGVPGTRTFYLGSIMWWIAPVYAFLWYGAGNYMVTKWPSTAVSVLVPAVYLSWVDRIAIEDGIWQFKESDFLNVYVVEHLPFEEVLFFVISTLCVVMGMNSYDKCRGMCETYSHEFPHRFGVNWPYFRQMCLAFVTPEYAMPPVVVDDIKTSIEILSEASKSFSAASFLFPSGKSTPRRFSLFFFLVYVAPRPTVRLD